MNLAAPQFLYALALLVPVLIAFLVRRHRETLRVPSTMVWRLGARSVAKSRRLRDVRRWLALAACLAGVAALAFAAARPSGRGRGTHVFVVDASASMAGQPLDAARRWLVREVSSLGPDARIAIVRAGADPRVTLPPSPPGPLVDDAIRSLAAESDSSSIEPAVSLAEGLAGSSGRVVVLTDGPVDSQVSRLDRKPEMRAFGRGSGAVDNLGITSLFTRTPPEARDDKERDCTVSVATSSPTARRAHLVIALAGRVIADRRLDIGARGEITEHVVVRGGGRLVAHVSPDDRKPDAVAIDDEASLEEVIRTPPRVGLVRRPPPVVTDDDPPPPPSPSPAFGHHRPRARARDPDDHAIAAFFVEKAIRAAGVKDIVTIDPTGAARDAAGLDVVVALADGPGRPLNVPTFFVDVNPDEVSHTRALTKTETQLRSVASDDPLMHGVSFDGITVLRATVPTPTPRGARSLVELDAGPVLLAGGGGSRAWVWLGIPPEGSDLVLRVAFPVLVANVLSQLAGASQTVAAKTAPPSEVMLAEPAIATPLAAAREPRWRFPAGPATLVAILGAFLLGLEAWLTFRRKWAL